MDTRIDRLETKLDDLATKIDGKFAWTISLGIAYGTGILGVMARGFGWI